ncbi:hypothetical protein ACNKHM_04055 [Shigella sonnei]
MAEINREREAFLVAQQGDPNGVVYHLEGNYADAVRLRRCS